MGVDGITRSDLPESQDEAVWLEQVRHACRDRAEVSPEVFEDAEPSRELTRGVGDERERELLSRAELRVELGCVDARAEDLDAGFAELVVEFLEAPGLASSSAGQCRRVEEDDRPAVQDLIELFDREAFPFAQSPGQESEASRSPPAACSREPR